MWQCSSNGPDDSCGWIAAIISMMAFGTFGVPIKGEAANSVDIDPLVMQSYKTFMCFVTSWIVLPLGQKFTFTPWGIVSGLFWVPSGVLAIYAIRNAGLAVSQGTWSSVIVLVSFVWGIFIFEEHVKSKINACLAIALMMFGLWGMSYYSAPTDEEKEEMEEEEDFPSKPLCKNKYSDSFQDEDEGYGKVNTEQDEEEIVVIEDDDQNISPLEQQQHQERKSKESILFSAQNEIGNNNTINLQYPLPDTIKNDAAFEISNSLSSRSDLSFSTTTRNDVRCCFGRIEMSRRRAGIISALLNGIWGGSIMVPMHYSGESTGGLGYVISFAIGATIVTVFLWIVRYCYHLHRTKFSVRESFYALPSFHVRVMWLPGGIAGTLWSIGNLCSMLSVQNLGEGVGYSVIQASMFVSGLWGIFWYKEVKTVSTQVKWLASAIVTLAGILLLSYEHRS